MFADQVPSPSFVIDLSLLRRNLALLRRVQDGSGAKILMALKGFSTFPIFPAIRGSLAGVCASGAWEARLGREEFGKEVHAYSAAFTEEEFAETVPLVQHMTFNSVNQWRQFAPRAIEAGVTCGLRINPEHSTGKVPLYDPCAPGSRLGTRAADMAAAPPGTFDALTGLHCHTLCEQGSDALEETAAAMEERFARWLPQCRWLNLGGGHHITREGYDIDRLLRVIRRLQDRYGVQIYLEPGEAVVLNTGFLVASVIDIVENAGPIAMLDVSATAHMPDVLEMPYRPEIIGAGEPGEKAHTYRLGGPTCLAGDYVGTYSFDAPLRPGDRLVFTDMAHYTMVKTTMFNGVKHPAVASWDPETGEAKVLRRFAYEDFRARLG
ncbi:MAG: carboxynorspermidine decarboxylase [Verrucomicrobiales bacterium]